MGKLITVASGKGGTGKTTTVAAVATCLAALGHRTLCVDFDSGLRNLDLSLGMAEFAVADFYDVLTGQLSLKDACHEHPLIENLYFISAPAQHTKTPFPIDALRVMFENMRREYDYCLIDSPAGIGTGFSLSHTSADMSIIVTIGELPAIKDAQQAACEVRAMGVSELRLLVNRVLPRNYYRLQTTIDDVINTVGVRLIGLVREDSSVCFCLNEATPLILYKKRLAAYDFLDVARRITGEEIPILSKRNKKYIERRRHY